MPKGQPKPVTKEEVDETLVATLERFVIQAQNALKLVRKYEKQPKTS